MALVACDIGGTFSDFVGILPGRVVVHKSPTDREDPARGLLRGLRALEFEGPLEFVHGTTLATNALLERKGSRTALITTSGFEDILTIARQDRPALYDWKARKPPPLITRDLTFGARERVDASGRILAALDTSGLEDILYSLRERHVESLAVSLLFSFLNSSHEEALGRFFRDKGFRVSLSSEVLPEIREYERAGTTAVDAYVAPLMGKYLEELAESLSLLGASSFLVLQSNGGAVPARVAAERPVSLVLSGPAAGAVGARSVAKGAGIDRILALDMGGTSTDVCLCDEELPYFTEGSVAGCPIAVPMIRIHTVGAGGGSVATLDTGGALRVGPESVGADPGPACYGRGVLPTVTDAHIVLGTLLPSHFAGGGVPLFPERSREVFRALAGQIGVTVEEAAWGVIEVVTANMERALRAISLERGHDPRRFTLIPFGGAGPLHACLLAEALGITKILVPPFPGLLSAFGMIWTDTIMDVSDSMLVPCTEITGEALSRIRGHLRQRMERMDRDSGRGKRTDRLFLDIRYAGQGYDLTVPVRSLDDGAAIFRRFEQRHKALYGFTHSNRRGEITCARLRRTGKIHRGEWGTTHPSGGRPAPPEKGGASRSPADVVHPVFWGSSSKPLPFRIFEREELPADFAFPGPAIVAQSDSTVLIDRKWQCRVDVNRNLLLTSDGGHR